MPDSALEKVQTPHASLELSEKNVSERALQLLRQEASKELLQSVAAKHLSKDPSAGKLLISDSNGSYLQTGINSVTSHFISDQETRSSVNHYTAEFVKTASLFSGGKLGIAATAVAYGLDQAKPDEGWKEQVADFALGATKGEALKGSFAFLGSRGTFAPIKGALMGLSSGAIDEVFKRETFTDPSSLNDRLRKNAFNPQAVLMNAAVFTLGEGLYSGINYAYKDALAQNRTLSGMVMGGSFGFVNGTVAEASREMQEKGRISPGSVVWKGLLEGGVSAAGAGAGIKVSDPVFQQKVKDTALGALDRVGLNPFRSNSREFVVTGGLSDLNKFTSEQTKTAITTVREVRNILGWEKLGPEKQLLLQHSDERAGNIPIPKLADLIASCNPEKLGEPERASHLFPNAKGPVYLEEGSNNHIRFLVGDQVPQWKNGLGGNRVMLGTPETKINAMAPLLIGDPANPDGQSSRQAWEDFTSQLQSAKKLGIDGISTDVWWGIAEPKQGQFQWNYYDKLSSKIIGAGLKWVPIESFHEAGGNVGDTVNIPVPFWVWNKISSQIPGSSPDVGKFKSEQGNVSNEYVQFWADKYSIPLYKDFMTAFGQHFAGKAQSISEINISLGPAGEARYPSYNHHDDNVSYPSRGAMQAYSDLAKADFKDWAIKKYGSWDGVNKAWGGHVENIEPPVDVDAFYKDNVHTNTQYGRDVIDWYSNTLINHIQGVMGTAFQVYGPDSAYKNANIGMKIPGIHWRIGTNAGDHVNLSDRLAEVNAGMIRTSTNDWNSDELGRGYRPLLSGIKQLMGLPGGDRLMLHFTALEMPDGQDSNMNAKAMPYSLAEWVGKEAQYQGIPLKGENALAGTLQNPDAWNIMASHLKLPQQAGYYKGLTLLRLSDLFSSNVARWNVEKLIKATHGNAQPAEQKNAS
jgi:beta-amylase